MDQKELAKLSFEDLTKHLLKNLEKDKHLHNAAALMGSLGLSPNYYDRYVGLCKQIEMMEEELE